MLNYFLKSTEETIRFGHAFAKACNGRGVFYLVGDLGVGKTTLCGGILAGLGHTGNTKSPTYAIVEPYHIESELGHFDVYHFDLYRLASADELEYIGIRDYLHKDALCLFEWPEKGKSFIPRADGELKLFYEKEYRQIEFVPYSKRGVDVEENLTSNKINDGFT